MALQSAIDRTLQFDLCASARCDFAAELAILQLLGHRAIKTKSR
jgi:hypothetical protein